MLGVSLPGSDSERARHSSQSSTRRSAREATVLLVRLSSGHTNVKTLRDAKYILAAPSRPLTCWDPITEQSPHLGCAGLDVDASAWLLNRSAFATALTADEGLAAPLHPQSDSPVR